MSQIQKIKTLIRISSYKLLKFQFRLYIFSDISTIFMILRFVPTFSTILRNYSKLTMSSFSEQTSKPNQKFNKDVLKIENCTSFSDVLKYLQINSEINEEQFKELSRRAYNSTYNLKSFQNYLPYVSQFEKIDVKKCSVQTLTFMSGLLPILLLQMPIKDQKIKEIQDRISEILKSPHQIRHYQLLAFLKFQKCFFRSKKNINELWSQFKERIPKLNIKIIQNYLEFISSCRYPTKMERQIFGMVVDKISQSLKQYNIPNKSLIRFYKYLSRINFNVYRAQDIVPEIEKIIKQKIDDLQTNQVVELINFRINNENKFIQIAATKILQLINEKGESEISPQIILKVLSITQKELETKKSQQEQKKILKFLEKNLIFTNEIVFLIKKQLLTKAGIIELHEKILNSQQKKNYLQNHAYIHELLLRNLYKVTNNRQDDIINLMNFLKSQLKKASDYNFIFLANLIHKVKNIDFINQDNKQVFVSQTPQFKQLKQSIQARLQKIGTQPKKLRDFLKICSFKHQIQQFYWNYKHLINIFHPQMPPFILVYFIIKSNDLRDLKKLIEEKGKIKNWQPIINKILQKITINPKYFTNNLFIINYLLKNCLKLNQQVHSKLTNSINNYLTNWQTHITLNPEQVRSFLLLAIDYVNSAKFRVYQIQSFALYFMRSPNHVITNSYQYILLMEGIQKKIIQIIQNRKNVLKTSQKVSQNQSENQQLKSQQKQNFEFSYNYILKQLKKLNILDSRLLNIMKQSRNKKLSQYALIRDKQLQKLQISQINPQNLSILFHIPIDHPKYKELIEDRKKEIEDIIPKLNKNLIQEILLIDNRNYQIPKQLFPTFIKVYCSKIQVFDRCNLILHHFIQNNNFHSQTNIFMQTMAGIYMKKIQQIPLQFHLLLISECLQRGIPIEEYLVRMIKNFDRRSNLGQHLRNKKIIKWFIRGHEYGLKFIKSQYFRYLSSVEKTEILDFASIHDLDPRNIKQLQKILNSDTEISLLQSTYNRLVKKSEAFTAFKDRVVSQKNEQLNQIYQIIEKQLKQNSYVFQADQIQGNKYLKIGGKYFILFDLPYTQYCHKMYFNYFSKILKLEQSEKKEDNSLNLFFKNRRLNEKRFVKLLSLKIPQINIFGNNLVKKLQKKRNQNRQNLKNPPKEDKTDKQAL